MDIHDIAVTAVCTEQRLQFLFFLTQFICNVNLIFKEPADLDSTYITNMYKIENKWVMLKLPENLEKE